MNVTSGEAGKFHEQIINDNRYLAIRSVGAGDQYEATDDFDQVITWVHDLEKVFVVGGANSTSGWTRVCGPDRGVDLLLEVFRTTLMNAASFELVVELLAEFAEVDTV